MLFFFFAVFFISSVGNKQTFIWWLDYEIKLNLFSYWFSAVVRQMNVRMYFTPQVNRFNWIRLNLFAVFLPAWFLNTQVMIKKIFQAFIYQEYWLFFFIELLICFRCSENTRRGSNRFWIVWCHINSSFFFVIKYAPFVFRVRYSNWISFYSFHSWLIISFISLMPFQSDLYSNRLDSFDQCAIVIFIWLDRLKSIQTISVYSVDPSKAIWYSYTNGW